MSTILRNTRKKAHGRDDVNLPYIIFLRGGGRGGNWCPQIHTGKIEFPSITRLELRSVESNNKMKNSIQYHSAWYWLRFHISESHSKHTTALKSFSLVSSVVNNESCSLLLSNDHHVIHVYILHLQILTDLLFQSLPLNPLDHFRYKVINIHINYYNSMQVV